MQVLASRVLLRPRSFAATLDFYERQLGLVRFREFGEPPDRGVVFFLGGGYLELTEQDGTEPVAAAGVRLWLQVPDVERAAAELEARGVEVTEPPSTRPWGLVEATVHDPDGLALVLVEVPDDHPLRRDTR